MSTIKQNILANLAGKIWSGLIWLLFLPVYLKFMGVEAYGLVGFYLTLTAVLSILDLSLSTTINRELARLSVREGKGGEMRDVLRTLETAYWAIAVAIGAALLAASPLIAHYWLKPENLSPEAVRDTVSLIGLTIALQWPSALYTGGMLGIQQQVRLNAVVSAFVTLRAVGAMLVLWIVSPTAQAFFAWHLLIGGLHTAALGFFLWRNLPLPGHRARFDPRLLKDIWRFAAGASGIAIFGTLAAQMDKIILSAVLPLGTFGYYSVAALVASSLYYFVTPITSGVFPRFSQLRSMQANDELARIYHLSCQLAAAILLPIAGLIALFPSAVLTLWTRDAQVAAEGHLVLSLLMAATALNGLVLLPFSLQLASGLVRLSFYTNLVSVIVSAPCLFFLASRYGAPGGAAVWLLLNVVYFIVVVPLMHRSFPMIETRRWYMVDTMLPFGACVAILGLARWLMPAGQSDLAMAAYLGLALAASYAGALFAAPDIRGWALAWLTRERGPQKL
jgi:O-antigen/teichoic acid export membrane protein